MLFQCVYVMISETIIMIVVLMVWPVQVEFTAVTNMQKYTHIHIFISCGEIIPSRDRFTVGLDFVGYEVDH